MATPAHGIRPCDAGPLQIGQLFKDHANNCTGWESNPRTLRKIRWQSDYLNLFAALTVRWFDDALRSDYVTRDNIILDATLYVVWVTSFVEGFIIIIKMSKLNNANYLLCQRIFQVFVILILFYDFCFCNRTKWNIDSCET